MADVLEHGPDRDPRGPLPVVWRRSRVVDLLSIAVCGALAAGLAGAAGADRARTSPPTAPVAIGSRPNLDLPPGANLSGTTVTGSTSASAVRYERTPSAEGLRAAVHHVVAQLCGGAVVDHVVRESISPDHARADVVLATLSPGVPTKVRPETGVLAVRLMFRRDGYEYAAGPRSGVCAG